MLNNLVEISQLSKDDILSIAKDAIAFKNNCKTSAVIDKSVVLMFFENSTRTKISFELAAKKLDMNVINFEADVSSINKGETLRDTIENLYHIGIDAAIIRTSDNNLITDLSNNTKYPIKFINAGSGNSSHPTQALLDFVTMTENLENIENKKIVIVGDIEHSRVAKSNIALLKKLNANISICAPEYFKPQKDLSVTYYSNLQEAITDADVIMGLRIQKERIQEAYSEEEYIANYRLDSNLIAKFAPKALIMHPGPVNRDIEMTSELIDSPKGQTILAQARNGMFTRMAILNNLLGEKEL